MWEWNSYQILALEGQPLLSDDSKAETTTNLERYSAYSTLNTPHTHNHLSPQVTPAATCPWHTSCKFVYFRCEKGIYSLFVHQMPSPHIVYLHFIRVLQRLPSSITKITCDSQIPLFKSLQYDNAVLSGISAEFSDSVSWTPKHFCWGKIKTITLLRALHQARSHTLKTKQWSNVFNMEVFMGRFLL